MPRPSDLPSSLSQGAAIDDRSQRPDGRQRRSAAYSATCRMCAEAKRMPDVREQVERLAPGRVQAVAQAALAEPGAALVEWRAAPLKGSLDALDAARSVFLFEGTARIRAAERPWCAVLKVLAPAPG